MQNQELTIRQMCDRFDVTPRTLRFYEAKELLAPRREGQKRLYSRRDRARMTLILRGKRFGFSLENIRQLLDLYDDKDQRLNQLTLTRDLAQERLTAMQRQRDELDRTIEELQRHIEWGDELIADLTRKAS